MSSPAFRSALRRFQLRWRAGLLVAGLLRGVVLIAAVFLLLGVFDYYAGFSDPARFRAAQFLLGVSVFALVWALWDAITFMRRDAALQADTVLGSTRRVALSGHEMQAQSNETPLAKWLQERALEKAAQEIGALPTKKALPLSSVWRQAARITAVALMAGALFYGQPEASRTITARLLQPQADIPPYSPFQFALTPQPAEVLYGGELLLTATITGGVPDVPVRCLTRDPVTKLVEESPAFQEQTGRFSRKLEKVAAPVEVAFAIGRARSAWLPVQVRTQPKLEEVLITVQPPVYSGRPKQEFTLGSQALRVLPGSRITAQLTSNRPLISGLLRITPPGEAVHELPAEKVDTHRVRFSWVAKGAALLAFTVEDVRNTSSDPLPAELKLLADERPEVAMRQPAGEILATPDIELPLEAIASDDYGLARVALVRRLVGYRERAVSEPVARGNRQHEVTSKLNLATFGVVPGQTIEISLEAADTNPTMLGVSVSEPARIHIITRDKYAELLRQSTTLEEFASRYEALQQAMEEARQALDEMEAAAKSGDQAKAEAARQKAFDAHQRAAQTFTKIARDFSIFDLDENLAAVSKEVAERLYENGKTLDELKDAAPQELAEAVPELKKRLGEVEQQAQKEMEKGERAVAAAKVIEQAGRFKEAIEQQRSLVRDFNRTIEQIRRGETEGSAALRELARRQREIAQELRAVEKEMAEAVEKLPEGFEAFKEESQKFLELLRQADVPPIMDEAAKLADLADSRQGGEKAGEALQRLEELLRKDNGVCKMCRGEGEAKFPWPQDLDQTMQQLMQSLIPPNQREGNGGSGQKPGANPGEGPGGSGSSDSGFSMQGKMPRLPMHGPNRSTFSRQGAPEMGSGRQGRGQGAGGSGVADAQVGANTMTTSPVRPAAGESAAVESIPETYREAAKRYFAPESAQAPSTP